MNLMRLPDGPGWSPDGGKFWVKGDLLYWSDGSVWDMRDGGIIRTMPNGYQHDEDYSSWSEERRSATLSAARVEYARYAEEEKQREERRNALRASALTKLTADEAEACELA